MSASNKKKILRRLWPALLVFLAALAALELLWPVLRQSGTVPVNDGVGTIYIVPDPALPANTLDSGDFTRQGDAVLYTGSRYTASQGVDVSEWQREIRWQEVADGGIDFAVIRCGYRRYVSGSLEQDTFFEENYSAAGTAGLRRGVYFFSQAITVKEAEEEARFVLDKIRGYALTGPVVFDWEALGKSEARTYGLDTDTLCRCALAFCELVEEAGYTPMIYLTSYAGYVKYDLSRVMDYPFWFAEYDKAAPTFYYHFQMWQYTSKGSVDGIQGNVDMNLWFGA